MTQSVWVTELQEEEIDVTLTDGESSQVTEES